MSSQKPEDETSRPPSSEIPSKGEAKLRDEVTGVGKIAAGKTERPSIDKPPVVEVLAPLGGYFFTPRFTVLVVEPA